MASSLALTSTMKMAKQASKGTAATTGFTCGRFTNTSMQTIYDYIETQGEHFCGINLRPTLRKTVARKGGYIVPFGGQGFLYPDFVGHVLQGLGLGIVTTGTTTKLHTTTIGTRASAPYMTVLHSVADGSDKFELRATDARVEQWALEASVRGIQQTFAGYAITEDQALGTETATNETDAMLLPSKGEATITINSVSFTSAIRGVRYMISNPLDRNQQKLWDIKRDDLPQTGMESGGTLMGVDVTKATYNLLQYADAAGTGPTTSTVTGAVSFKFESAEFIEASTPYSLEVIIPKAEFRLGQFTARGADIIRTNIAFLMVDDNSTPLTIKITNGKTGY